MLTRRPMPGVVTDPRSWGLIAVSLIYLSRGAAYTFTNALDPLPYGLDVLAHYVSIKAYGACWLAASMVGFWMAFWRVRKVWGTALFGAMPTLWGLAFLVSWVVGWFGESNNAWTGTFVYGCLAVIAVAFGIQEPQKVVFLHGGRGRSSD